MPAPGLLAALPPIERTRELTRALAVLDLVMSEDWEYRHYSFDVAWAQGEQMASMRNGSGDDWFCWFGEPGAAIVGFDHESAMTPFASDPPALWPGLLDGVPEGFRVPVLEEPAFAIDATTFVIWRERGDDAWRSGPVALPEGDDPDGAGWMLALLAGDDPTEYVDFAAAYYEVAVDRDAVAAIYAGRPLTAELVRRLNPERDAAAALAEAAKTGHAVDGKRT